MLKLHKKGSNENSSQITILFWCELYLFTLFEVSIKRRLKSVNMYEFVEKTEVNSGCLTFVFLGGKSAVEKLNSRMQFTTDKGKNSNHVRILRARIAIEETV